MMKDFCELWPGGPVFRQAAHVRLGTDSVLLADFVNTGSAQRGIDLGCASGILALLLLTKSERLHMTGLELAGEAAEIASENMERNGLRARSAILPGDIRRHRELFAAGSFDLAVANPPYFPLGSGRLPRDPARAAAPSETDCSLDELCAAAAYLLPSGGSFALCHRPERLAEVFAAMGKHGIEPKRLRLVCARADSAPNLALIEGRRDGRPGLRVEPILVLADPDGNESAEYQRIYHR